MKNWRLRPPAPLLPLLRVLLLLFIFIGSASPAHAAIARILYPDRPAKHIHDLHWNDVSLTNEIEVQPQFIEVDGKTAFRGVVHLEGVLAGHAGWIVVKGEDKLKTEENKDVQRFEFDVPIEDERTPLQLFIIGQKNQIEEEKLELFFYDWPAFKKLHMEDLPVQPSRLTIAPSLGYTTVSYRETLVPDFAQTALSAKLTAAFRFNASWDAGLTPYLTLLPLTSNIRDTEARFLGLNFRVGYVVPRLKDPWKLTVMAGIYYTTMFVTESSFGFQNLMGPQIFPMLRRTLSPTTSIAGYLKFSPVGSGIWITSLANREIAGGASFSWIPKGSPPLSVSLDAANLALQVEDTDISSTSVTLSVGISL